MVAIIEQHVHTGGGQFLVVFICHVHDFGVGHVQRNDFHGVRSDGERPNQTVFVVTGLRQTGNDAIHADTITAHDDRMRFFLLVHEGRIKCFAVLRAELEDVTDFNAAHDFQASLIGCLTTRAGIARSGVAKIIRGLDFVIPTDRDVFVVCVGRVRTGDRTDDLRHIVIGNDRAFQTDRTGKPDRSTGDFFDRLRIGEFDVTGIECPTNFAFVRFVIASQQHAHRLAIRDVDQRFHQLFRFGSQHFRNLLDAGCARRVDFFERRCIGC